MKRNCECDFIIYFLIALFSLFLASPVFATINITLESQDVTLSKSEPFAGDTVRIFARLNNLGDEDVLGYVTFSDNNKQISSPQVISIKKGSYDDVFVDWKVTGGEHKIELSVFDTNNSDQSPRKNKVLQMQYSVDADSDGDGIGDMVDTDDDNDELPDDQEIQTGSNPLKSDTDSDGVNDKIDAFPLDKTEIRDTNNNGIGDNVDPDADGDNLPNIEEIQKYGTNPISADSDNDGLLDNEEIKSGTEPNKADTDGDGIIDSKDALPLDASKWQAGLMNSILDFLKTNPYSYFVLGSLGVAILFFLFRKKKRR
jgi:hypothetical protein